MSERPSLPDKDWRELSNRISTDIVDGFDIEGITDLLSVKQRRMLSLPKDFRVHKVQHNRQLDRTTVGLGLYGELDRAVAGLIPMRQLPVEEYRIADYSTLGAAIDAAYFFCLRARRTDLVQALQPMRDVNERYYTSRRYYLEGEAFQHLLDFSEQELQDRSFWTERKWMEAYILATAPLGEAYLLGGSHEYPQAWLLNEIGRYVDKVFSTPGYKPFNKHAYRCDR